MRTDEQVWADIVNECRIVNSGARSGVIIRKDAELKRLQKAFEDVGAQCAESLALNVRLENENEGLNRMLRESQAGQGPIDCYVAQCEEMDTLRAIVDLAEDYIEGDHDYHLHADFETVRVPIARQKREDLRVAIARFRDGA